MYKMIQDFSADVFFHSKRRCINSTSTPIDIFSKKLISNFQSFNSEIRIFFGLCSWIHISKLLYNYNIESIDFF